MYDCMYCLIPDNEVEVYDSREPELGELLTYFNPYIIKHTIIISNSPIITPLIIRSNLIECKDSKTFFAYCNARRLR